ncbi:hypothetical protein JOC95_002500 [Bacillus tianshenii]|uniref:Uncharacterized protein n=1 Tax=Sutcliffiella tianshenii TaxID=1463404 RepID=A0ABS2P2H8_9BACI|nr:hypothetical protein [Bacillus tianshenii]MBM7620645.1 hypothetical protein [Bacillus tianshenii]MCA1320093.1 hypothetical protein [Bacillus tianshenii]
MSEEQVNKEKEQVDADPFTRLMFGQPRRSENPTEKTEEGTQKKFGEDYYALIEQVDSIMDSVNKLKPMLKEFSPIIDYFKKK